MKKAMYVSFIVLLLFLNTESVIAAQVRQNALQVLNLLAYGGVAQMKYKFGGEPGGEDMHLDDSNWKTVEIGYKWSPSNSNVWFRTVLNIPDHIGGFSIVGRTITLKLQVDNAYDLFVNEQQFAKEVLRKGETVIAHNIQPGQRYVIAIRGINRPGPGQLIDAQIEFSGMEDFQKKLRQYINHFFTVNKYARLYPDEWGDIKKDAIQLAEKIVGSSAFKNGNEKELIELLKRETKELSDICANWLTFHHMIKNDQGVLLPWTSWNDALEREMNWYQKCPIENGYPNFVMMTFMDANYELVDSTFIPATQNGMGIISYLKYYNYKDKRDAGVLRFARLMGDYLIDESITPNIGKYPRFSRSTGWAGKTPQPPDCGSQGDGRYEIEPDKGGIAGYALLLLFEETGEKKYLDQALQNSRVLAANMREGDKSHSPWPFRVDYRSGEGRGNVSGNMSFILRLFDGLIDLGYDEFKNPRSDLWSWILKYQLPNAEDDGQLWVQFFEDHEELDNRTAWSALNMARYLIERKSSVDQHWREHSKALIEFVNNNFTSIIQGIRVCGEQDYDKNAWGGVLSTYGSVLAMYSAATGSDEYKLTAYEALNFCLYSIRKDGCSGEGYWSTEGGGWQEDCHMDVIHNYIDAIEAFPVWASNPNYQ